MNGTSNRALNVGEEPAVMVLFTHDCGLAARVAWPLWCEERDGGLTPPVRHWGRREPADPATVTVLRHSTIAESP